MTVTVRTIDPAHDLLRSEGNPLDAIFRPALARRHWRDRPARQRGPHAGRKYSRSRVRRSVLPDQSPPKGSARHPRLSLAVGRARPGRTCRHRHPSRHCAARHPGMCRRRRPRRHRHLRRLQGNRRTWRAPGARGYRRGAPRQNAHHRPQLPRRDESIRQAERNVRTRHGAGRLSGFPEPEWRAVHVHPGLELAGKCRLQRLCLHRLHARRRMGRPHRLFRRRSPHAQHPAVHRIRRRSRCISFRRARGSPHQAHHRHQGRTLGSRRQGRRVAYRRAHRQRRCARRRIPPLWRAARRQHRRSL